MIERSDITGLVVAGGRATRMGGVDKGLQTFRGVPLALYAMLRLAPQVGEMIVNANRNLAAYESMGVPVWPDPLADHQGPLAGWLAGLEHCSTPYMATVPCDAPNFPIDLVERLARALTGSDAEIATVTVTQDGDVRLQPLFSLLKTSLLESLVRYLQAGERRVDRWTILHRRVDVHFEDGSAFGDANTAAELQQLQAGKR